MKKKIVVILIFCLIYSLNLFYPLTLDEIWNYGFSYNILNGQVPYRDFNMVLTPLFSFIMTLPLAIFGNNILVFNIFNIFILLLCTFLLYKLVKKNFLFCVSFFLIPFYVVFPSYNVFLLFLFILLIYLEKNKHNDYLIGFVLGCLILTKQSVGCMVLLPGLFYYHKDKKKLISRIIGCLIPCGIFLIYLLITKSFFQFLDLCLFGLLDFAKDNSFGIGNGLFIFIVILIITVIFIIKDTKNIYNYYALMFYSISIPIFDLYHLQFQIIVFILLCLLNYSKEIFVNAFVIFIFSIIVSTGFNVVTSYNNLMPFRYPNKIRHFEYRLISDSTISFTNEVNNFISKNKNSKIYFLDNYGYYFRIINDEKIDFLDLVNLGNWGYNGRKKIIKYIESLPEDSIFLIDKEHVNNRSQIDKNAINYIYKHGKNMGSVCNYDIYVLEE